jgi:Flp pilus assembly protein TadB
MWTGLGLAVCGAAVGLGLALAAYGVIGWEVDPARPPGAWEKLQARWRGRSRWTLPRLAGAVLAAALVGVLTRWPVAAVGLGALVAFYPALAGQKQAETAHVQRLQAVVTWCQRLRDAGAAHNSLASMIRSAADSPPAEIREPIERLRGRVAARVPLDGALLELAADLDHSADLVIAALRMNATRQGDRLVAVLSDLARAGQDEVDLQRKITASRAGDRRSMRIMVGAVLAFATFLVIFGRSYAARYESVTGQLVLLLVGLIIAATFMWLKKLTTPAGPTPFLADADNDATAGGAEATGSPGLVGSTRQDQHWEHWPGPGGPETAGGDGHTGGWAVF